jgi:hypothetical protein
LPIATYKSLEHLSLFSRQRRQRHQRHQRIPVLPIDFLGRLRSYFVEKGKRMAPECTMTLVIKCPNELAMSYPECVEFAASRLLGVLDPGIEWKVSDLRDDEIIVELTIKKP